ncbi:MAG: hypothetical protein IAI49_15095 [Candidatus Eremiobacteraeota bacterium]|nr:hypothetical protein [Candidatus Eremiobacteraeota bacterium]
MFRFRHALTREAIYQNFLGAELRPRHRTIAGALEDAPPEQRSLESLAYHWWAAGDAERAVRYNELAGDAAANVHAHENAIALYERALEFPDIEPIARASIVEKIAARRQALTWNAESRAAYNAAADIFRDARAYEREAGCRVFAAIQAYTLKLPAPTAPLDEMLTRLQPAEYLARSRVHLGLAWLAATLWFPSEAEAHMAEVDPRALEEAADIGLRYHNISAWVAMTIGDIDRFVREHAAWVEAAKALKSIAAEAGAHYNGAMCFSYFGRHERAREEIDRALRIARESDSAHARESAHAISAMCYLMSGDLERARAAVEAVPASTENHVNLTFAAAWGAFVGAYLDDEALIEKWFDRFETSFAASPDIDCGGSFAEIMVRRGRPGDAATLLSRAVPDCELMRGCITTLLAVAKYGDVADRNRAREQLARAAAGPHELPERPALALFEAYVLLREGRLQEAAAPALRAAEGFGRLGFPLLRAAALEAAGDVEAARKLFRDCGATYDVRRLEARTPSQPGFAPLVRSSIALLSAREREIAALAAKGHSNLEIARELSISHKTVEKHLASVYQKLGVSSRTHLVAYLGAQQRGSEQRAAGISTN